MNARRHLAVRLPSIHSAEADRRARRERAMDEALAAFERAILVTIRSIFG